MNCCDVGTYKCAKIVKVYYTLKEICIDKCIIDEIKYLWVNGIKTGGSCCGHGKEKPTVAIYKESIPKMIELGYKQDKRVKEGHVFYLKKDIKKTLIKNDNLV